MTTFIQVNIYNQSLETLKMRGIDLKMILKTIDCPDTWISEVPIVELVRKEHIFISPEARELTTPLKRISSGMVKPPTLRELFDDWDPVSNLPGSSLSDSLAPAPAVQEQEKEQETEEPVFKTPKEEPLDETVEMNDSEQANEHEQRIIQELLSQQAAQDAPKSRRQLMSEDPDIANTIYSISCCYPNCTHQYNWRVKYGKLRLLDHALTHSNRTIPCKLCGFKAANVRRMRSHYAKEHPTERVQGYGMKALVAGDGAQDVAEEEELKELWRQCYLPWIGLIGEACGSEGYRRCKKRKMEPMDD